MREQRGARDALEFLERVRAVYPRPSGFIDKMRRIADGLSEEDQSLVLGCTLFVVVALGTTPDTSQRRNPKPRV